MKIRLFTLPNFITLGNLFCGAMAIVSALVYEDLTMAFWLIVAAAVCDFFDGMVARMMGISGPLGVQLDSLADDISFGLVPAVVMFDLVRHSESLFGLGSEIVEPLSYVALIVAAFSALRLGKFNIDTTQSSEFEGLPTPANALMLLSLAQLVDAGRITLSAEWLLLIAIVASLLLVSPIRMFSLKFKGFGIKGNELRYGFILLSLALILLVPAYSILAIIVLYIVISTLRWLMARAK